MDTENIDDILREEGLNPEDFTEENIQDGLVVPAILTLEEQSEEQPEETAEDTATSEESNKIPDLVVYDESTARFSGTPWYDDARRLEVTLIGAGGIGSNVAYQIARLGILSLLIYDSDEVEEVNLAGQMFKLRQLGIKKVNAVADVIKEFTPYTSVYSYPQDFSINSNPRDIMICGLDNMIARKTCFDVWCKGIKYFLPEHKRKTLFIDGRLSVDTLQVFCISGADTEAIAKYEEEFLFSDKEADATVCSMKQTTYLACMIGSVITNLLVNFLTTIKDITLVPYELPFFTQYDATTMEFITKSAKEI